MRVAIFSPYATVAPHFETEMELAQRHLDEGDQVDYISCLGELPNCDFNRTHDPKACIECVGRRRHGLALLSSKMRPITFTPDAIPMQVPQFESLAELLSYRIEGFDIGCAVTSSLVSFCRDPEPDMTEHRELIEKLYRAALQVFQFTQRYIESNRPDRVYVFNGRFAAMRAVLRACQLTQVECFLHERGCDLYHFDLFENHLPHDIERVHELIQDAWQKADPLTRERIGSSWFHDRVNRVERNWHSFVKGQQHGRLPQGWDSQKRNVGVFCSSDDEFVAIGPQWKNKLYGDQLTGIKQIARSLQDDPSVHFYLRMHPNLATTDNATKQKMLELSFPNLTIIAPEDQCDTYQLMRSCDQVVTFGSSIGIEAVFWDRPSILLGPCLYQYLSGPHQPQSHEEVVSLVRRSDLEVGSKEGAIQYGHWFQTHGIKFEYFEPESLFHGKFKGQVIYARPEKRTIPQLFRARAGKFIRALMPAR